MFASILSVTKAQAIDDGTIASVVVYCDNAQVSIHLPPGTAEAVAACINVAVAAGAQAEAKAAAQRRWNEICEAMNKGTWSGSEQDALDEIARCKAIVEGGAL